MEKIAAEITDRQDYQDFQVKTASGKLQYFSIPEDRFPCSFQINDCFLRIILFFLFENEFFIIFLKNR